MPSRNKAIKRGEKLLLGLYCGFSLPLFFAELTNFPIVIPKKTTDCAISTTIPDIEAFHT